MSRINALWAAHGTHTIVRTRSSRRDDRTTCVDYFLQRFDVEKSWNLFHAIRDTRDWSSVHTADKAWGWSMSDANHAVEQFRIATDNVCRSGTDIPVFYVGSRVW